MLIAARNGMMVGGGKLSAKSYVQDGLVAMWDGIENAGYGVHDPNATVWKDLCNNGYDATILPRISIGESYCASLEGGANTSICPTNKWMDYVVTIEVVGSNPDITKSTCFCGGNVDHENNVGANIKGIGIGNDAVWVGKINNIQYGVNGYRLENNKIYSISSAWSTDGLVSINGETFPKTTRALAYWNAGGNVSLLGTGYTGYIYNPSTVYCARLYSRALTASEIAANYAVDKARFNLP